ncbi:MAG: hypothetical protein QOI31_517, partial [Solirubrobacterales bacterium]|nr:hypothetical protein [Solirubrobacterales bacterium]
GVRRRPDLLLTKIEDRVHDGLTLEVMRDVDVLPFHGSYDTIGGQPPRRDIRHIPRKLAQITSTARGDPGRSSR